jgi:hypothetical protein
MTEDEAVTLCELTKTIVRIERKLGEQAVGRRVKKAVVEVLPD